MYENRCVSRAYCLRNFGENCVRSILESYGPTENLADGVEQIDFFVPLGKLDRRMIHFLNAPQNLGDEWKKKSQMFFSWLATRTARRNREPGAFCAGYGRDEHCTFVGAKRASCAE